MGKRGDRKVYFHKMVMLKKNYAGQGGSLPASTYQNSYDGRFAYDGNVYMFANDVDANKNQQFWYFDNNGMWLGQYNLETYAHGVYFSWSVCRYQLHAMEPYRRDKVKQIFYDREGDGKGRDEFCW